MVKFAKLTAASLTRSGPMPEDFHVLFTFIGIDTSTNCYEIFTELKPTCPVWKLEH